MRKRSVLVYAITLLAVAGIALYAPRPAATQSSDIPQEVRDFANSVLQSDNADFVSNSTLSALGVLAGKGPDPSSLTPNGEHVEGSAFGSTRFEILVNNPAQDTFTFFEDVSTQSETAVAGRGSNVVVAFNDSSELLTTPLPFHRVMGYSVSTDGGASFTDKMGFPTTATGFGEGDPALVVNRAGTFYAAQLFFDTARPPGLKSTVGVQKSTDGGFTFGTPVYVPSAGLVPGSSQDKEFLAVDNTGGAHDGSLYLSWTSFPPTPPAAAQFPIVFSRSTDGGTTFSTPMQISATGTFNQGSAPTVGPDGHVYVAWHQFFSTNAGCAPHCGSGIFVAKSTDGGMSFGAPVFVAAVVPIGFGSRFINGTLRGGFRVNSLPRIDVNPVTGSVYVIYNSNPPGPDGSDIFFTRSTNGGASWSAPIRVNDDPGTNDQFFPTLAVNGQGVVQAIWYDRRRDPNNLQIAVYTSRSVDDGVSFRPNQQVTTGDFFPSTGYDPFISPTYMGDYIDIKSITAATGNGRGLSFLLAWGDCRRTITTFGGTRPDQDVFFAIQ